jgi:hypothetical protein
VQEVLQEVEEVREEVEGIVYNFPSVNYRQVITTSYIVLYALAQPKLQSFIPRNMAVIFLSVNYHQGSFSN